MDGGAGGTWGRDAKRVDLPNRWGRSIRGQMLGIVILRDPDACLLRGTHFFAAAPERLDVPGQDLGSRSNDLNA